MTESEDQVPQLRKSDPRIQQEYSRRTQVILLILYVVLFIGGTYLQFLFTNVNYLNGLISQFQVLISVYVVVRIRKSGLVVSCVMNGITSVMILSRVLRGVSAAWPGVVIPFITVIILCVIAYYLNLLNRQIADFAVQNDKLTALYSEVSTQEIALQDQNQKLTEYTEALRENEARLHHIANFDLLTELPNRDRIISQLELLTAIMIHRDMSFSLIFLDLDNFKHVNDSLGHQSGDHLLRETAKRLKTFLHPDDILGRMGGDEFAVVVQRKLKENEILDYVEKIRSGFVSPFTLSPEVEVSISASFGIVIFPQDGTDTKELLTNVDTALYKAKEFGRNGVQFYRREMKEEIMKRAKYETSLLNSIQNNELFLMYQPQFSSGSKELRGFETLVRWESAKFGLVSPTRFISVAESAGFIVPMGEWILRTACKKFVALREEYGIHPILSVNISAVQIMSPSFYSSIRTILEETGFEPANLELEITESVFINSMNYVVGILQQLRELGIRISLDDFGTGYSSLSYLQMLPIETLKIDKSFIDSIDNRKSEEKCLVSPIITLMHQLGITVVAEGVDSDEQLEYLRFHGCDYIQGYIWGRPIDDQKLREMLFREYSQSAFPPQDT